MSRFLSLVLTGLLAVLLVGAPAQASPRSPDPERVQPAARVDAGPRPGDSVARRAIPMAIDSDVYVYTATPTSRTYFVVTGRLKLKLRDGSTTAYRGTFVDYVGMRSYKASADASDAAAPTLKLETRNGKFTFRTGASLGSSFYSGTATARPAALEVPTNQVFLNASSHAVHSASYDIVLSQRTGVINHPIEHTGTMTIVYDANNRISGGQVTVSNRKGKNVTHTLSNSGYYSTAGYLYTVAKIDTTYFGITATVSGTTFNGFGFAGSGASTTQWVISGTA